jgi:hypothetical protein
MRKNVAAALLTLAEVFADFVRCCNAEFRSTLRKGETP